MDVREAILSRLPGSAGGTAPHDGWRYQPVNDLVGQFTERLTTLAGRVVSLEEAKRLCPASVWVDEDAESSWGGQSTTDDMWQAGAGVTTTICAVAQTGTLLLSAGYGKRRMASLAPPVHIALVDRMVPTIADAVALVPDATSVFVTGPSRTADIEGVLVNGVHGPGQLWVVLMEGLRVGH